MHMMKKTPAGKQKEDLLKKNQMKKLEKNKLLVLVNGWILSHDSG